MALREILASFGIEVETKELEKGNTLVDQFKEGLVDFGKAVVGAFAVKKVIEFGKELINQADEVREAGIALGIVPQHLQQLEFAASTAGVEVGELRASLAKFNRTAAQSAEGKGAASTFKELGIELKNANGTVKTSGQLFEESGAALAKVDDPIKRAGLASELFGRSYAKLLPLFSEGEAGIAKLKQEAKDLGFVFDDAFLDQSDEINDNLTKLKGGFKGLAIQAIAPLLPDLVALTQGGVRLIKELVGWAKSTKLLQAITGGFITKGVLALARAGGGLIAKMGGWRVAFARLGAVMARTILPLLLLEDLLVFLAGGDSVIGDLLTKLFGDAKTEGIRKFLLDLPKLINDTFEGIIEGGEIAVALLKDAFAGLWNFMSSGWRGVGKLLEKLGFKDAAQAIKDSNFATVMQGGNLEALQAKQREKNLKKMRKSEEERQGRSISDEEWEAELLRMGFRKPAAPNVSTAPVPQTDFQKVAFALGNFGAVEGKKTGLPTVTLSDEALKQLGVAVAAKATAPAPPPQPITQNVSQVANVNINVTGAVDDETVSKIKGGAKSGTIQGLNLRATHAALVQRGG